MRRRGVAALAAIVTLPVIVGVTLVSGVTLPASGAASSTPPPATTATVERRTLDATTQVAGTLGYADSYAISNGRATATSDPLAAAQSYASAQAQYDAAVNSRQSLLHPQTTQVIQAQAQLAQVKASLVTTTESSSGPTPQQLDQARATLAQAQAQLAGAMDATTGPTATQLATAQAQLAQAQAQLVTAQQAAAGPSATSLAQAQAQLTSATSTLTVDQAAVAHAQAAFAACTAPPPTTSPSDAPSPTPRTCDPATLQLAVQEAQARVATDQAQLASAQAGLASLTAPNAQAQAQANLVSAQAAVASAQAALDGLTAGTSAQAQASLQSAQAGARAAQASLDALLHGDRSATRANLVAARAQVTSAQAALRALLNPTAAQRQAATDAVSVARAQLAVARAALGLPRGVVTSLAATGAVVQAGGVLYTLDGAHPVVLLVGETPAWRTLRAGIPDGRDVHQLETNLAALGYGSADLKVDTHWDAATTAAVKRWQRALRVPHDGTVPLGSAVFEPGAIRVVSASVALGATVGTGAVVLQATSTRRVVSVALGVASQLDVKVGDTVEVELPDTSTTAGTVSQVGSVATPGQNGSGTTIPVTVTLDDPSATGTVDQAPVQVSITTASAANVLTVPVEALVALAEGGYAIEVEQGGGRRYVGVELGLFADGWVEISGSDVSAGQTVIVPR